MLGDRGSSYAVALTALRRALREVEHSVQIGSEKPFEVQMAPDTLLVSLMTHLQIKTIPELATWSTKATKTEVAALAQIIIHEFRKGNKTAESAILQCVAELAEDCTILIKKLSGTSSNRLLGCVEIGLTGSLFTLNEDIAEMFKKFVLNGIGTTNVPNINFSTVHETVYGALKCLNNNNDDFKMLKDLKILSGEEQVHGADTGAYSETQLADKILPVYLGLPQTECRNEASMNLDTMPIVDAIDLMIAEESKIYAEISKQKKGIEVLIEKVSSSLKIGGRLFYVGAGTSGRLGILDATECRMQLQYIIWDVWLCLFNLLDKTNCYFFT